MQCQNCKRQTATIHLTEITDGVRSEAHLCESCAQKQGITAKTQIPLNELLNTLLSAKSQPNSKPKQSSDPFTGVCPHCGIVFEQFGKQSLLGCPNDYEVFQDALRPIIKKTHDNKTTHRGKVPSKIDTDVKSQRELLTLRKQLDDAIHNENYELAAELRDKIGQLQ